MARICAAVVAVGALAAAPLTAQRPLGDSLAAQRPAVTAGSHYRAGGLHRFVFGSQYRELWATVVAIARLDLDTTAGGLVLLRRGGFGQTRSLHFAGANGRRYVFRSVDKDPSQGLPADLRGTFVESVVRDQVSSLHPYGALVVAPLLDAAGILHVTPRLAVMPDDPRLGEHRSAFAGVLGLFEERPDEGPGGTPGWGGFSRIVSTETLFRRLTEGPEHRLAVPEFLAARLMDLLLGDRDRHTDQWRWARSDAADRTRWRPIPRDRDQAFVALDGLVMKLIRLYRPQFVRFGDGYPNVFGAMYNGYELDRRLLGELERGAWDSVAAAVTARLTDSVIDAAVQQLPRPVYVQRGAALAQVLKRRRDGLPAAAAEYYAILTRYADLHATDRDEFAEVRRDQDGSLEVTLAGLRRNGTAGEPYLRRRFAPTETREVRLYLHGGDDRVVVRGDADQGILVRVVGGRGDDELSDSSQVRAGRATFFYDDRGDNRFVAGPSTRVDRGRPTPSPPQEAFVPPPPPNAFARPADNWGKLWVPAVWLEYTPDLGVTVGGGAIVYKNGFRRHPYLYRMDLRVAVATARSMPRVRLDWEFPAVTGGVDASLRLRATGVGMTRFHGFGNETVEDGPDQRFEVTQQEYFVMPALGVRLAPTLRTSLRLMAKVVHTDDAPGTVLDSLQPPGLGTFGHAGVEVGLTLDTRDRAVAPSHGVLLRARGRLVPPIWSVAETFGRVGGDGAAYVTATGLPGRPTLAVRVGAERVLGDFPFFEAAFLGGATTVRGFREFRFAGDAALYGNVELRLRVASVRWIVPGDFGVFALGDAGRVFLAGEASEQWHKSAGGGIWFAPISRGNTVSLAAAASAERFGLYLQSGFMF